MEVGVGVGEEANKRAGKKNEEQKKKKKKKKKGQKITKRSWERLHGTPGSVRCRM